MKYTDHNSKLNMKSSQGSSKRLVIWAIAFSLAVALPVLLQTKTANASLFSFLSFLWGQPASAETDQFASSSNSQTLALLEAATNIDPNPEKVGEISPISAGETLVADIAMTNATSTDVPVNTQISTYVVQNGDTVSSVAKMFGVSVNTVIWSNNLTSRSVLRTGQNLVILPISGITYTVKKGETIQGIAKKYNADVNDILTYNDITISSPLTVGQSILIPDGELSPAETIRNNQSVTRKPSKGIYEPLLDGWNYPTAPAGYYSCPVIGGRLTQGLHGHNAIDIAAPVGTPLHAAHAGTVIISRTGGWNGGYGNFVVISHSNGSQTLYAHMSHTAVSAGDTVSQNQTIGYIGMTGLTTGPHVHFEVRGAQNPCVNY